MSDCTSGKGRVTEVIDLILDDDSATENQQEQEPLEDRKIPAKRRRKGDHHEVEQPAAPSHANDNDREDTPAAGPYEDDSSSDDVRRWKRVPGRRSEPFRSSPSSSSSSYHQNRSSPDLATADWGIRLFATISDETERRRACSTADGNGNYRDDRNDLWSVSQCSTLREMLGFDGDVFGRKDGDDTSTAAIDWLVICNYLIDVDFLLDEVPELLSVPGAVTIFYGHLETPADPWRRGASTGSIDFVRLDPSDPPSCGGSNPLRHRIPYGVHHSKIFLVGFSDGRLRVIVHTANLRWSDIHLKAQVAYIQDFSSKAEMAAAASSERGVAVGSISSSSSCDFEEALVSYFATYGYGSAKKWAAAVDGEDHQAETLLDRIRRYDFSPAKAVLIPSAPGYHRLDGRHQWGHLKLRQAVARYTTAATSTADDGCGGSQRVRPIVCQFSSMGSLTENYLRELQSSMDTGSAIRAAAARTSTEIEKAGTPAPLRLQIVYPTVEEIQNSVEGYAGGVSVPGPCKNVNRPFLRNLYRRWSSSTRTNPLWKGRNVPHAKTYYQVSQKGDSLDWFVITSHNLSKAAWGEVQNTKRFGAGSRRLFIRHWELGVFVSPGLWGCDRILPWSPPAAAAAAAATGSDLSSSTAGGVNNSGEVGIALLVPLPFKLYPEPYRTGDRPWAVDVSYSKPDRFGRFSVRG